MASEDGAPEAGALRAGALSPGRDAEPPRRGLARPSAVLDEAHLGDIEGALGRVRPPRQRRYCGAAQEQEPEDHRKPQLVSVHKESQRVA